MQPNPDEIAEAVSSGMISPEEAIVVIESMIGGEGGVPELNEQELEQQRQAQAEERQMRLRTLGARLHGDAERQVTIRQEIEERWYKDVRQHNGVYEPGSFSDDNAYGSRVFVPLTRRLVNLCEARLYDMIFQSDRRFYSTEPTPVPDIDQAGGYADQLPAGQPINLPQGGQTTAGDLSAQFKTLVEEAKTRNDGMMREIDDQLAECNYPIYARDAIHDAVMLGTGILKGPVPQIKTLKQWQKDDATGSYSLFLNQRPVPVTLRVDPWNFFPDMSATAIADCERVFERHFLTKRQVSELQGMEGADKDALRKILESEPSALHSSHRERLRSISGASNAPDNRYEIWEYHGPVTAQELKDCGCDDMVDDDPLNQYVGIVWFCKEVVIKAAVSPMDSGELPYRVFNWQKDEGCIFGFGLPYEARDQQISANSSWRAMQDNMGLCVKPQIVIDDSVIEPVDGSLDIAPGKAWRSKRPGGDARQGLMFVQIESRLQELQSIFAASKGLIEEIGAMPGFLQGSDAPAKMQSATEASINWTAANLWVRRCVRNWDDDMTTPMIKGYYDWNMQYSTKAEIKGDLKVRALGVAYLAELEGQSGKLQTLAQAAGAMGLPLSTNYAMLRELSRSLKLDPDVWLPSEIEIKKMKEQEQKAGPQANIEQMKVTAAQENNQMDHQLGMERITLEREEIQRRSADMQARMQLEIADTAGNRDITQQEAMQKYGFEMEKANVVLQDKREQRSHDAQALNAEMQLKAQMGSGV